VKTMSEQLIETLREAGLPVTRENYILLNWGSEPPDPWTPEDEDELPEELQMGRDSSGKTHDSPCSCARCRRHAHP
jgi:hypothetical protein